MGAEIRNFSCLFAGTGECCFESHQRREAAVRDTRVTIEFVDGMSKTIVPYTTDDYAEEEPTRWRTQGYENPYETIFSWWDNSLPIDENWDRLTPESRKLIHDIHHKSIITLKPNLCPYWRRTWGR